MLIATVVLGLVCAVTSVMAQSCNSTETSLCSKFNSSEFGYELICNDLGLAQLPCASSFNATFDTIDLFVNLLTSVPTNAFGGPLTLGGVEVNEGLIILEGNLITVVEAFAFANITSPSLNLDLAGNQISSLEPFAFAGIPNGVSFLSFQANIFALLEAKAFIGLNLTGELVLDWNPITSIKPMAFNGMNTTNTSSISLANTKLTTILPGTFSGLSLQSLVLSGLPSGLILKPRAFRGLQNSTVINLIDNQNMVISSSAFGVVEFFECGNYDSEDHTCSASSCSSQCGESSICIAEGYLTPDTIFTCGDAGYGTLREESSV